jgi:DNA-binding NtrC family response regulator
MQQFEQKQKDELIVGQSEWSCGVRKRISQIANFRYNVLVTGPSGTGKELVARAVHAWSDRSQRPFIPVNCAAIPASLFSSQLFGHVKGAFTGAQHAALGCFRAADGGTLFLDEIGDLDLDSQAKLLRVLQERKVTPVGGLEDIEVDVRTIAATNRDLAREVQLGRFRLDLFYRLNVLSIETQALAQRTADIEPLANHFLAKAAMESGLPFKVLTRDALRLLHNYPWPGNVRELQNTIERALVMTEGDDITALDVQSVLTTTRHATTTIFAGGMTVAEPAAPCSSADARESVGGANLPAANPAPRLAVRPPDVVDELRQFDLQGKCKDDEEEDDEAYDDLQWMTLAELEAQHIRRTLRKTYYNQSAAARLLGVDRKLLARKMKKFGIAMPKLRHTHCAGT